MTSQSKFKKLSQFWRKVLKTFLAEGAVRFYSEPSRQRFKLRYIIRWSKTVEQICSFLEGALSVTWFSK
jgi:hypothetical protein